MKNRIFYFNILRKTYLITFRYAKKILGLNDSPHAIALGVAIGMFVAFTPTAPLQMTLAFCIAWIFHANKTAAIIPTWVTNPITNPPIFFGQYLTGAYLFGYPLVDKETFAIYTKQVMEFTIWDPVNLFHQIINLLKQTWHDIGQPLLIGSIIWAIFFGIVFYFIALKIVIKRREAKLTKILFQESDESVPKA